MRPPYCGDSSAAIVCGHDQRERGGDDPGGLSPSRAPLRRSLSFARASRGNPSVGVDTESRHQTP